MLKPWKTRFCFIEFKDKKGKGMSKTDFLSTSFISVKDATGTVIRSVLLLNVQSLGHFF